MRTLTSILLFLASICHAQRLNHDDLESLGLEVSLPEGIELFTVEAELIEYKSTHPWTASDYIGNSVFSASPAIKLRIKTPIEFKDRAFLMILQSTFALPNKELKELEYYSKSIGEDFIVRLPKNFLEGDFVSIMSFHTGGIKKASEDESTLFLELQYVEKRPKVKTQNQSSHTTPASAPR